MTLPFDVSPIADLPGPSQHLQVTCLREIAVACVVVAYHPNVAAFDRLLGDLDAQGAHVIVVDNSGAWEDRDKLEALANSHGADYLCLGGNRGIGEAHNRGIRAARQVGYEMALLLDQDTHVTPDLVGGLRTALTNARAADSRVAAVGPNSYDYRDGAPLVASFGRLGPKLTAPSRMGRLIPVPFLIASGTLLHVPTWETIGPFRAEYFIDHIDLEWGLRATTDMGFRLVVATDVLMAHELADISRSASGGLVRRHSQVSRQYYLTRNYIHILRDIDLPPTWRLGIVREVVRKFIGAARARTQRREAFSYVLHGLADGVLDRRGPLQGSEARS